MVKRLLSFALESFPILLVILLLALVLLFRNLRGPYVQRIEIGPGIFPAAVTEAGE